MKYDPQKHHRHSIRFQGYDYSRSGAYFVTIVAQDRASLFGEVVEGEMRLNDAGRMIWSEWVILPERFPNVVLDEFVVMPNHVHGIIVIVNDVGAGLVLAPDVPAPHGATGATTRVAPTLGDVVGAFKSRVTVEYIRGVKTLGWMAFNGRLWQRNYYEHIIRDEVSLNRIRRYIAENPQRWTSDSQNPSAGTMASRE